MEYYEIVSTLSRPDARAILTGNEAYSWRLRSGEPKCKSSNFPIGYPSYPLDLLCRCEVFSVVHSHARVVKGTLVFIWASYCWLSYVHETSFSVIQVKSLLSEH